LGVIALKPALSGSTELSWVEVTANTACTEPAEVIGLLPTLKVILVAFGGI